MNKLVHLVFVAAAIAASLAVRTASGGVAAPGRTLPLGTCRDPIAGVWQVRQHSPRHADWHLRTLRIERVPGSPTALRGVIETEVWEGGADQHEPGPCQPGAVHYAGTMPDAAGTFEDPAFTFGARTWTVERVSCGTREHANGYNPDHFAGQLDREREELRTVNNDGARSVDESTIFRRIACLDPPLPAPPPAELLPTPAPAPPTKAGCGCG